MHKFCKRHLRIAVKLRYHAKKMDTVSKCREVLADPILCHNSFDTAEEISRAAAVRGTTTTTPTDDDVLVDDKTT